MSPLRGSVTFLGFGEAPPDPAQVVGNDRVLEVLAARGVDTGGKTGVDTERLVGVRTRWWSSRSTTDLAIEAARRACDDAAARSGGRFSASRLQLIHSGGSSPDDLYPACACRVQGALGVEAHQCEARDISLACTSWLDALLLADARMRWKGFRFGLVVNGETVGSRMNAPTSLSFTLWGDGAGGVVLEHDPEGDPRYGLVADGAYADGGHAEWTRSVGIGLHPDHRDGRIPDSSMEGHARDIHRFAIREVSAVIRDLLEREGARGEPLWLLPHNANLSMVQRIGEAVGVPEERILTRIAERGNTSSASLPITLALHAQRGTFRRDDLLLLAAFGGGMSTALALYRWP